MYSTSLVHGLRKLKQVDRTCRNEPRLLLNLYTPVCIFSLQFKTEIIRKNIIIQNSAELEVCLRNTMPPNHMFAPSINLSVVSQLL